MAYPFFLFDHYSSISASSFTAIKIREIRKMMKTGISAKASKGSSMSAKKCSMSQPSTSSAARWARLFMLPYGQEALAAIPEDIVATFLHNFG